MANTKVVNKKPRTAAQKRADAKMRGKSRRKNPRRRTTKRYGAAARAKPRRRRSSSVARRRAPATKRYSRATARRSNPRKGYFDFDYLMTTVPAATMGVWSARWAIKMAGPFEADSAGVKKPGIKHLIAAYLGATMGGQLIASVMGEDRAGDVAEIAAFGYLGDLWAREFVFDKPDSWYRENLYLGDDAGSPYSKAYQARGLGQTPQGQTFTDANGRQYVKGPRGWQLAGSQPRAGEGQNLPGMGPMGGFAMQSGLGGFAMQSGLGQGGVPAAFVPKGYMQKDHGYDSKRTIGHTYTYGGLYGRH